MLKGCQLRLLRSIYTQRVTKGFGVFLALVAAVDPVLMVDATTTTAGATSLVSSAMDSATDQTSDGQEGSWRSYMYTSNMFIRY